MSILQVGDHVPDVTLSFHDGSRASLRELYQQQNLVLFFYPKDGSPICTKQACAFRDAYEEFNQAAATVIGISSDSLERHQNFADGHRLPFLLAADSNEQLRQAFGIPRSLGLLPGRVTFVVDQQGVIRLVFNSQFSADRHVKQALKILKDANNPPS
jgi:peroxiredoxin Q/BCP